MTKTVIFMFVGVLLGAGAVALWRESPSDPPRPAGESLVQRVATLEASLGRETRQREALAAAVGSLKARLNRLAGPGSGNGAATAGAARPLPGKAAADTPRADTSAGGAARRRFAAARGAERAQRRIDALVAGGFTPQRAQWIEQQADRLRMQQLEARYAAARAGKPFDPRAAASGVKTLHDVLGDDEYAQYLKALGLPTSISVRNVLPSSPAQQAGLEAGDRVVGYAGRRVFNVGELNRLTLAGTPGQQVEVDVVRDGTEMQLYVPRGPLGITGGWFRGRP